MMIKIKNFIINKYCCTGYVLRHKGLADLMDKLLSWPHKFKFNWRSV